jgi:hypothetical protein
MNEFILLNKSIKIDTEKIGLGLLEMHKEDEHKKAVLAFGMLDAKLMDLAENNLKEGISKQFDKEDAELFKIRIDDFVRDCIKDISNVIYSNATMVV